MVEPIELYNVFHLTLETLSLALKKTGVGSKGIKQRLSQTEIINCLRGVMNTGFGMQAGLEHPNILEDIVMCLDFENIEILSGLSVGDKVIKGPYIAISQKLKDGTIISESKDSSKDKGKNSDDNGGFSVSIGN